MSWLGNFVGNLAGQFLGNSVNSHSAKQNAEMEAKLQRENWEYMQKNKHQFEVADLRAAGLNPILSAGQGSAVSAPSISGDSNESNANAFTTAKQLKIAENDSESNRLNAEAAKSQSEAAKSQADTAKVLAESQAYALSRQAGYYDASSAFQYAQRDKVMEEINAIKAKLPYEIDKLVADTGAAHAAARLSLASIDLVSAQADLTFEETNKIKSELNDPKKLLSKEFWNRVLDPKTKADQVIHDSFMRGLENDILFSFYGDSNKEIPIDVEKIATVLARGKYITKK